MMIREFDVELPDGRTLHGYDTGDGDRDDRLTVVWHHGTPNIGTPPEPLFPEAERLGSAGWGMTGRAMAGRALARGATWARRPATPQQSPMPPASIGSR